jgi:diketogulonate reductase-like aldo/keto reductase
MEEGWTGLARLQKEGKVRYIGVSNLSGSQMRRPRRSSLNFFSSRCFPAI